MPNSIHLFLQEFLEIIYILYEFKLSKFWTHVIVMQFLGIVILVHNWLQLLESYAMHFTVNNKKSYIVSK